MTTINTNRDFSFITLEDGSLHTYEARPRSVVPEGIIAAGTELEYLRTERVKGLPNTEVYVDGAGTVLRLHVNHVRDRGELKALRGNGGATKAAPKTAQQLRQELAQAEAREAQEIEALKRKLEAAGFAVSKQA